MATQNNSDSWQWLIQVAMVIASIILFFIGVRLILEGNPGSKHGPATAADTRQITVDSTITDKLEKDSAGSKLKTTRETKKEYKSQPTVVQSETTCTECLKVTYDASLDFFALGSISLAIAFFLPRVTGISFRNMTVQLKELQEKIEEAKSGIEDAKTGLVETANAAAASTIGTGGKSDPDKMRLVNYKSELIRKDGPGENNSDPQKGAWGGKEISNDRSIAATVKAIPGSKYYQVTITVKSAAADKPLTGKVEFHLHPTFANPNPVILINNGIAELRLIAWGAFTLGAVADNGNTTLELDLAEKNVDAPEDFKSK